MEKSKKAQEEIDFYKLSDLKKKLLIVNAVSIRNQATPHLGYAEMLGLPLMIISSLISSYFDFAHEDAFLIFVLAIAFTFYFGMNFFLKKMAKAAEKNYPTFVNFYKKEQQTRFINGVFWRYFICYYALAALIAFGLFYFA